MNINSSFKYLLSILTISSSFAFTGNPTFAETKIAQNRFPTTFHCIKENRSGLNVTVAKRGNRQTSPLFIWKSNNWGSKYPPQERCRIVSQRLTTAVAKNGGKLSGLYMTHGIVNNYPVICYVNDPNSGCTSSNLLLTLPLSEKSFNKRREVLQSMANFSKKGTGPSLYRGSSMIDLENMNDAFSNNSVEESPSSPTTPTDTAPVNPSPQVVPPSQPVDEDQSI